MKIIKLILFLYCFQISLQKHGYDPKGMPFTPKALDLEDHFGTNPANNFYGPQSYLKIMDIPREFDSVDGNHLITPISNLDILNKDEIIHGDLNNTAYDASRIITPQYAVPKAEIKAKFIHDAVVNTPVLNGYQTIQRQINTFDTVTGQMNNKIITTEKPIVEVRKNLRTVETDHTSFVNLLNGHNIDPFREKTLVGI